MRAELILAFLLTGCGLDQAGLGGETTDSGGIADAAVIGEDSAVDPSGDALPTGAISYFRATACPSGWSPYEPAKGRFVVATIGAVPTGKTTFDPLESGEERAHQHGFALKFALKDQSFATASGGSNGGVASKSDVLISGRTEPASTGLPYVQLLVCQKRDKPSPRSLPAGMQVFFESTKCPEGWTQTESSQGRFVVGLPRGAAADQTFGRAPGASGAHTHTATATIATKSHGIAAFSGCCADGYAQNASYEATSGTDEATAGLPTIELLSCTKS